MIEELEDDVSPEVMISLRDLRVSYGEREILHGVSFDVMRGETMVILGGSGSGKSTLLRTLVGLEKPSSGEVILRGKKIATASIIMAVAYTAPGPRKRAYRSPPAAGPSTVAVCVMEASHATPL